MVWPPDCQSGYQAGSIPVSPVESEKTLEEGIHINAFMYAFWEAL